MPDAGLATFSGIFDVLQSLACSSAARGCPTTRLSMSSFSARLPIPCGSPVRSPCHSRGGGGSVSDVVIVPSLFVREPGWVKGRYPRITDWIAERHAAGATICSACSGLFLIAETGLFDGVEATVHWPYARMFAAQYPAVRANPERALVVAGGRGELVSSGASTSWHDLVLYLIGRDVGPVAAQAVSKFFALWSGPLGADRLGEVN